MKFLFIVQGEGRGHLTQAIALEEMLLENGHEVVEVLAGKSFHLLNDEKLLLDMASCKAYATTAGFESVCEAMYFGKPI